MIKLWATQFTIPVVMRALGLLVPPSETQLSFLDKPPRRQNKLVAFFQPLCDIEAVGVAEAAGLVAADIPGPTASRQAHTVPKGSATTIGVVVGYRLSRSAGVGRQSVEREFGSP